jgi:hypothetical protein
MPDQPRLVDVVALLDDLPDARLPRGQVGTVVELLDPTAVLVEFSDEEGRAYAVRPVAPDRLLTLHDEPAAA